MHENRIFGGRYRAEQALGQGGFGLVLTATDQKTDRKVALKVLRGSELDTEARSRFDREARVVQRLTHPNTVRLYDFGAESDGTQYIVYELLQGETLTRLMQRGALPWDRTVKIGVQVLKSLSEAHELGIVHRDVKPANVMLVQFAGDADVVKLLDFGIAKPLMNASKALTQSGIMLGTPRFMSPEQVRGENISPRSDLYSLGILLTELVSGRKVFQGDPVSVMMEQVSPAIVPIPAEVRNAPFGPVLERALRKDPAERYSSALEMLTALESTAGTSARSLTPPAVLPAYAAPERSNAGLLVAIAGGFVALLVLGGIALAGLWFLTTSSPAPPAVVVAPAPAPAPVTVSAAPVVAPPTVSSVAPDVAAPKPKKPSVAKPAATPKPGSSRSPFDPGY